MTPLRRPAPERTTGATLADTEIHAGKKLAAGRWQGAATMVQPRAANPDNKMMEVTALAGGLV
jgi:hypothetical protein